METKDGNQVLREKFSPLFMRYVPKPVASEFRKFAVENAGNNYGVALKMLLDSLRYFKRLSEIEVEISEIKAKMVKGEETVTPKSRVPKTIGNKKQGDVKNE